MNPLHLLAPDGVWTWFNDARALWHRGYLFFGYVKFSTGRSALAVYDPRTGKSRELFEFDFSLDRDDHNNPSIVALQDGRLLASVAFHGHSTYFPSRRSLNELPLNPEDWEAQRQTPVPEPVSYQNLHVLTHEGGRIYNFMRLIEWNPTLVTSDDQGATWSEPVHMIQALGRHGLSRRRPYLKSCSNGKDRIDVIYTDGHPQESRENSIYHFYIREGRLWTSDGRELSPTLTLDTHAGENGTPVYVDGNSPWVGTPLPLPGGRSWMWDIAYSPEGYPVVLFQVQSGDETDWHACRIYYCYARWTPTEGWRRTWIAHGGRPLYEEELHYGGGMALDPNDPRIVHISTNAERPFDLDKTHPELNPNERYELHCGMTADGGKTFQWRAITANSDEDHLRPYIPRGGDGKTALCFRGDYRAYTDFQTGIVSYRMANAFQTPAL